MSARIDLERKAYAPGETLRATVRLAPPAGDERRRVEVSVLWETSGKGDTDLGVVLHRVLADGDAAAARGEHRVEATLPALPLSYAGQLVKLGWFVRVRRLALLGVDDTFDAPFTLEGPRE